MRNDRRLRQDIFITPFFEKTNNTCPSRLETSAKVAGTGMALAMSPKHGRDLRRF